MDDALMKHTIEHSCQVNQVCLERFNVVDMRNELYSVTTCRFCSKYHPAMVHSYRVKLISHVYNINTLKVNLHDFHTAHADAQIVVAVRDLAPPGDLTCLQTYSFEFNDVEMQYDSYRGLQVRLR